MKEPSIQSITLEPENWNLYQENDSIRIWVNNFGDILSLNFFHESPNLPEYVYNIHSLRNFYRDFIVQSNGAIVEVEKEFLNNLLLIKTIFKIAQEPTGFSYIGSYSLIMEEWTFIIKVECQEKGTTGIRESAVLMILDKTGLIPKGTLKGWFYDPYDPEFKSKVLNNMSDQEKYDEFFPNHPLSRVRNTLRYIIQKLKIGDEIKPDNLYFKEI